MKLSIRIKSIILKLFAKRRYTNEFNPKKIKKILIIREGGIGDAICLYPFLRELKKVYPSYQIDIYAGHSNRFMYDYSPYVNHVYTKYKKRQWYKSWLEIIKMKNQNYDVIIDMTITRFERIMSSIIIGAPWFLSVIDTPERYGYDKSALSLYYKTFSQLVTEHIITQNFQFLSFFNIPIQSADETMEFFVPQKEQDKADLFVQALKEFKLIGLNSDASHVDRTLSHAQIKNLSKQLEHSEIKIILFYLPNKEEEFKKLIHDENLKNIIMTYPTKSIYDAAALIKNMDVMITPDTSFVHIASGLNTPTVGLFWNALSKSTVWGPRSDKHAIVMPSIVGEQSFKNLDISEVAQQSLKLLDIYSKPF